MDFVSLHKFLTVINIIAYLMSLLYFTQAVYNLILLQTGSVASDKITGVEVLIVYYKIVGILIFSIAGVCSIQVILDAKNSIFVYISSLFLGLNTTIMLYISFFSILDYLQEGLFSFLLVFVVFYLPFGAFMLFILSKHYTAIKQIHQEKAIITS